MPKKTNKKKKTKTRKPNKKIHKKETRKKGAKKKAISKEEILEEAAEEELEKEIEEIDEEIEEKETGEKKAPKTGESKKILGRFSVRATAIFIGEAAVAFIALILIFLLLFGGNLFRKNQKTAQEVASQTVINPAGQVQENDNADSEEGQKDEYVETEKIDASNWSTYTNKYYGFELKYPPDWNKVAVKNPVRGSKWVQRYEFRKKNPEENDTYLGFNVTVYDVKKTKELKDTEEFPAVKEGVDPNGDSCQTIEDHLEENPNYPNEEIYFPASDDCYNTALFYSLTREEYIYNVIPVYAEGFEKAGDLRIQTIGNFPEFFESVTSFNLIDIVRPKPMPAAPKITAPRPVAAKSVGGKLVCAKKTDHPGKSKTNKKKHLDMECCLDPDEYPNPWCYYNPNVYGKYLK